MEEEGEGGDQGVGGGVEGKGGGEMRGRRGKWEVGRGKLQKGRVEGKGREGCKGFGDRGDLW